MADPTNLNSSSPSSFNQPTQAVENSLVSAPTQQLSSSAQAAPTQQGARATQAVPQQLGGAVQLVTTGAGSALSTCCPPSATTAANAIKLYANPAALPDPNVNDGVFARVADVNGDGTNVRGLYIADNGAWRFIVVLA